MKGYLGEFEELVLLIIAANADNAYSVVIRDEIQSHMDRTISLGALHSTLTRLEEKGYITSVLGGATATRGGRKKRFFDLTTDGKAALAASKELRDQLWNLSKIDLAND